MSKKVIVFISSKMGELREERDLLADLLPTLSNDNFEISTWVFELDARASTKSIRDVFLNALADCDLYIGIFWNEYGEWTIDEFQRASELGIDRHIYVKNVDTDKRDPLLERFLERQSDVRFGITPRWYTTSQEFQEQVTRAVTQWLNDRELAYHSSTDAIIAKIGDDLPDLPRKLIGRKSLIKRVNTLLEDNERVLLRGFGGMGKTAIAATIAADYVDDGYGDVIWVRAGTVDADGIFDAIARAYDVQQDILAVEGDERIRAMRHLLAEQNALLVLDDVWDGSALAKVVRALPRRMPLLSTSRQRFPLDQVIEIGELEDAEALRLLESHAGGDYSENADAKNLCDLLGNHAFALEIAGKQIQTYNITPTEMLQRIEDTPHDLSMPAGFGALGRRGIKSLLDASIDALNRELYDTYVAMGGLLESSGTAEVIAYMLDKTPTYVDEALLELVQRGLVNRREQNGLTYYQIHDLAFSYARNLYTRDTGNTKHVVEAYQRYAKNHVKNLPALELEYNALIEAAEVAYQHDDLDIFIEIMRVFAVDGTYFAARGHTLRSLQLQKQAYHAALESGDKESAYWLIGRLGNAYANFFGRLDDALDAYNKSLDIARDLGNTSNEAVMLTVIGTVRFRQGADDADKYHQQAEEIARENDDFRVLAQVLHNRGAQYIHPNNPEPDYAQGRQLSDEAAQLAKAINGDALYFYSLRNRGAAEHELGNHHAALKTHQEAHDFAKSQKYYPWMGDALYSIGEDYHQLGRRDDAQEALNAAMTYYKESGVQSGVDKVKIFINQNNYEFV